MATTTVTTTTSTTEWTSSSSSTSLASSRDTSALATTKPVALASSTGDLELRVLQAFGGYAAQSVVQSYSYVKHSSRVLGFVASTTEKVVTKTGLVALVGFVFAQYQRLGHPLVQYVDEAMGRRIISAFVNLLLLAQDQQRDNQSLVELESGGDTRVTLSYQERLQALLQGEVPRLQALLLELQAREAEAIEKLNNAPPPVVMDLEDFVPKEEVQRLEDFNREMLADKEKEVAALKEQVNAVERARQQLEQDLTDVHNYQESERGRRFQDMEEELARTKLEASQKAHDLRKLELVVEAMSRKKLLRTKGSRSDTSAASSDMYEDQENIERSPANSVVSSEHSPVASTKSSERSPVASTKKSDRNNRAFFRL